MLRQNIYSAHGDYLGWFDVNKAQSWTGIHEPVERTLYRAVTGQWVNHEQGAWTAFGDREAEAYLRHNGYDEDADRIFNPAPPRMGRPEVGPTVQTKMPQDLIDAIDNRAEAKGMKRSEWIRQVLTAAVNA